jgi:hypothetical protein
MCDLAGLFYERSYFCVEWEWRFPSTFFLKPFLRPAVMPKLWPYYFEVEATPAISLGTVKFAVTDKSV